MQLKKGCRLWWAVLPPLMLDRISKHAAASALAPHGVRSALPGILSWVYTENRGAAFSILSGKSLFLILLTLLLIGLIFLYLIRHPQNPVAERLGLWCILAGGLGNLWDRLAYGHVIDFIRLDFVNFAIFNVADIFVCGGAGAVILSVLLEELRRKKNV